jgi:hypothetical protein
VPLMSVPDTAAANVPDISVDVNSPVSEAADWVMDTETGCSIPLLDVTPRSVTLTIPDHRPPTAAGRRSGETPLELPQPAVTTSSDNSARARGVIRTIANQFTPFGLWHVLAEPTAASEAHVKPRDTTNAQSEYAVGSPASASRGKPTICASVNRFFIVRSFAEDRTLTRRAPGERGCGQTSLTSDR